MFLYQMTRPVAYLFIKEPSGGKKYIDWYIPSIVASLFTLLYFFLPIQPEITGEKGAITSIQGFLQIMPGFYLAALAAVATFNKTDLDRTMPKPAPKICVKRRDTFELESLTRRSFLNYLFGYLTFLSLFLYVILVIVNIVSANSVFLEMKTYIILKTIFLFLYQLFFIQMILVTIFSLYQLCERIHQYDNNEANDEEDSQEEDYYEEKGDYI